MGSESSEQVVARESEAGERTALEANVASDRTAFAIGWDLAYYGQLCEEVDPNVQAGHAAGQARFGAHTAPADRFVRKWLLLRRNAWRRHRVFSEDVTPEFIREIDVPRCLVLGIELTHGARADTDWSVDRLNNDGAYACGNLVVMSSRANTAKGTLTFKDVLERANAREASRGLAPRQWLRLASLMAGACSKDGESGTCFVFAHPRAPRTPALFSQFLQALLLHEQRGGPYQVIRQIRKRGMAGSAERAAFDALIKRMRKRERQYPEPFDFWTEPALYAAFERWYLGLSQESLQRIDALVDARVPRRHPDVSFEDWSLETHGYYRPAKTQAQAQTPEDPSAVEAGAIDQALHKSTPDVDDDEAPSHD